EPDAKPSRLRVVVPKRARPGLADIEVADELGVERNRAALLHLALEPGHGPTGGVALARRAGPGDDGANLVAFGRAPQCHGNSLRVSELSASQYPTGVEHCPTKNSLRQTKSHENWGLLWLRGESVSESSG